MHACHSRNYYFIKELLPLAGVLWHCCEKSGMAPEGEVEDDSVGSGGGWEAGMWRGDLKKKEERWVGRKHALIWVISQPTQGWVTELFLHPV